MNRIFARISIVVIIILFFPHSVVVEYYIQFLYFLINIASACFHPTKPASRGYISPKPFVTPRQWYTQQVLFMIRGDGSLGSRSCKTIHYSSYRSKDNNESSEEEGIEVSLGQEIHGNRSLGTIHSSSCNCGGRESRGHSFKETIRSISNNHRVRGSRPSLTIPSPTRNCGGYIDRCGSRSQDTSHWCIYVSDQLQFLPYPR